MQGQDEEITTLTSASTKSKSLRTTIPIGIVRQFKFREGDNIRWKLEAQGDRLIIIIEPLKELK